MVNIILFFFVCFLNGLCRREHKTCEFELHDVFAVDVIVSTGDGKVNIICCPSGGEGVGFITNY